MKIRFILAFAILFTVLSFCVQGQVTEILPTGTLVVVSDGVTADLAIILEWSEEAGMYLVTTNGIDLYTLLPRYIVLDLGIIPALQKQPQMEGDFISGLLSTST